MKTETAETLSAKQYILSAAENRYNRKSTSLRGGPWPLGPLLGSAPVLRPLKSLHNKPTMECKNKMNLI